MVLPLPYSPTDEQIDPNEADVIAGISEQLHGIMETTARDYGHTVRGVHAKSHGLLEGEMTVVDNLPSELAQGVFATPGQFPVVIRLSTNPGDILPDDISVPRGMALKIIGVPGERLPGSEGATTQDFVMANAPTFSAKNAAAFLGNLKLLAKTTDRGEGAKSALSAVARVAEAALEAVGGKSATLVNMGGQPATSILGDTFYSQVPLRYGEYVAKLAVAPVSPGLMKLTKAPVDISKPNAIRDEVNEFFAAQGGEWEVRVQLRTDADKMPIEDASVEWPQDLSPYVTVARISAKPQPAWSDARAKVGDDSLAFSPWHGTTAHQPLGGIMRARKAPYTMSSTLRAGRNGCPIHEPTAAGVLPG